MAKRLFDIILLALAPCLLVGFLLVVCDASKQQALKTHHENRGAAERKNEPGVFKPLTTSGLQEISAYCNSYPEKERKNWPQAYYCDLKSSDLYIALFSGLLVFVTFGLVWVGIQQYRDTRILQRAYISVGLEGIAPYKNEESPDDEGGYWVNGLVKIANAGNLAARDIRCCIKISRNESSTFDKFLIEDKDFFGKYVLAAKNDMIQGSDPIKVPRDKIGYMYVWGRVWYLDGFKKQRRLDFCHRYPRVMTRMSVVHGIEGIGVPAIHGRYHLTGNDTDEDEGGSRLRARVIPPRLA